MPIAAVVFDIGNVLIEWDPMRFYDRAIGEARCQTFFAALDLDGMNERIDLGENHQQVVTEFAAENPDWHDEIMMWHANWIDMASPAIDRSVRLLRALRRKAVPVYALSNFGTETFATACGHYPFLEEFDRSYISGHLGMMKPDPAIYAHLEVDSGTDPATLFFTDDRTENIAAAADRGWQTHHFDGPDGLAQRLVAEGLLQEGDAA